MEIPRTASKESIIKAYKHLRSLRPEKPTKRGKKKSSTRTPRKKPVDYKKDRLLKHLVLDFSRSARKVPWQDSCIMEEIRRAMSRQDWIALQRLYPLCGSDQSSTQPIRFTYAFLMTLCSPLSNEIQFKNFLETCISHDVIERGILARLVTLGTTYRRPIVAKES